MKVDLVVPRRLLLDGFAGETGAVAPYLRGVLPHHTTVVVRTGRDGEPWVLWIGDSHALVARGCDPVSLSRIRRTGAPLAVLDALDLRRGGRPRAGAWWEIRVTSGEHSECIQGFDRTPEAGWVVRDAIAATTVEPITLRALAETVSAVVERHAGIDTSPSLA